MSVSKRAMHVAVLTLCLLVAGTAAAQEKPAPMANPLGITASDCQSCHPQHYREWEQSYHAKSVVAIHAGFKKYITTQEQARGRALNRNEIMGCLGCHAPAMRFASDDDFSRLVQLVKTDQREALAGLNVDCVACHALFGSGHPETKPAADLARQTFYSTLQNPARSPHGSQVAPQMATSEFCKTCHTYVTPAMMHVDADWDIVCTLTFDSWAAGPNGLSARGADRKECQNCHMEKQDGKAAEGPGVQAPARKVSSHRFPGWHDAGALQKATEISLATQPGSKPGTTQVVVTIDNQAGHRIPDT